MSKTRTEMVLEALGIENRRVGKQRWSKCPNPAHVDRHPSWRIRDEPGHPKDGYHACPPCGFAGGILGLIVHVKSVGLKEPITYKEAHEILDAIEKGLGIEHKPVPASVVTTIRKKGFMLPAGVSLAPFANWPRMAAEYALDPTPLGRGLTVEQIFRWGIGFADEGRLAHRLVLVTRNAKGVAVNYTARTYVDHVKRYFEPEHWEKADRNVMFGEQHWQSTRFDCAVVTEGGFKALAVERACPDVALAATSGSAIMPGYPIALSRFKHVIVSTDADDTGDRIADELMFMLRRQRQACTRMRLRDKTEHDTIPVEELQEHLRWARAGRVA